jgi:peroxiredoxin
MAKVEINTKAPDFTLPDFTGKTIHLTEFQGKNNILLVFNRTFT